MQQCDLKEGQQARISLQEDRQQMIDCKVSLSLVEIIKCQ